MSLSKVCKQCKKIFVKKVNHSKKYWKNANYCSVQCSGKGKLGINYGSETQFKKGNIPWDTGLAGMGIMKAWNKKYSSEELKQKQREWSIQSSRNYRKHNKIKIQARGAVNKAILNGELVRLPCEKCGNPESEAHHYKGYAKKYWLTIRWYCRKHHREIH